MPADEPSRPTEISLTPLLVRRIRWRATLAFVAAQAPDPHGDPEVAQVLERVAAPIAAFLASEFLHGYAEAAAVAREATIDRRPLNVPGSKLPPRGTCGPIPRRPVLPGCGESPEDGLVRSCRWFGQFAYARGIDRSPWHDITVARVLKAAPNEVALRLIPAWEAGWDGAHDFAMSVRIERKDDLDVPRIISVRQIGTSPWTSKEQGP